MLFVHWINLNYLVSENFAFRTFKEQMSNPDHVLVTALVPATVLTLLSTGSGSLKLTISPDKTRFVSCIRILQQGHLHTFYEV
jgi:hypothetical protein